MAKANQAYHKRDLYSDAAQVMTLARYYAKQAVKAQWQGQGVKLSHVEASELVQAANAYLTNHPELVERARATLIDWDRAKLERFAQRKKR